MFGSKQEKKVDSAYFDATNDKVAVRPGMKAPIGIWVHQIHQIEEPTADGQKTVVRRYGTELCTSTGRNGSGCRTCSTKDPLWDRLEVTKKTNKRGQPVHFPKKVVHVMIVKNLKTNTWQILKGGNQLYEPMGSWYDSQTSEAMKDLRRCEWVVHSEGVKMRKKYFATRLDASNYDFTDEDNAEIQRLLKKANDDMAPKSQEEFIAHINASPDAEGGNMFGGGFSATETTQYQQPTLQTQTPAFTDAPQSTSTASFAQPKPSAAPQQSAPKASNGDSLARFSTWMGQQPEFVGTQLVSVGIPMIKEFLNGNMNYYTLPSEEIDILQAKITARLEQIRNK